MSPTHSSRARGAQIAVMALGFFSALALIGASLTDFGDPRATARAQAQQLVRTELAEVRLAWDEARTREGAPPGGGEAIELRALRPVEFAPLEMRSDSGGQEPGPLTRAYFEMGRRALLRGDAAAALESLNGGLAEAAPETRGYREALFGALRAAGALGKTERVQQLREDLDGLPDVALDGTSLKLLAALVHPVDAHRAQMRLRLEQSALPPPRDRVAVEGASFKLLPDPWWSVFRTQLEQEDDLDWETAFRAQDRLRFALSNELREANLVATDRWTIAKLSGGCIAVRQLGSITEVVALRPEAFASALLGDAVPPPLEVRVGAGEPGEEPNERDATPLPGSPFSVSVTHLDPEGAATPELRRLRILRSALVGLALLVLLATLLSARAMGRAQQLSELRSTFVASVSHDLRTPTQAILLMAQTLEQNVVEAPEGRARYHTQIRKEAQRLRRLVEDLLDGARVDRGDGARIERRNVPAKEFFDELTAAMEERASSAGARIGFEIAELPATLYVDPDGLYRSVWNLFENALRYGRVGDQAAEIRIAARATASNLEVEVSDAGPGIPQQHAQSIFSPFERLSSGRSKPQIHADTGTGLGLAIVRAICIAHGGSVELTPAAKGATFVLSIPMLPTEEGAP